MPKFFRDAQGRRISIEEIEEKIRKKRGINITSRRGVIRRVIPHRIIFKRCEECGFPVLEKIREDETQIRAGCPYCGTCINLFLKTLEHLTKQGAKAPLF